MEAKQIFHEKIIEAHYDRGLFWIMKEKIGDKKKGDYTRYKMYKELFNDQICWKEIYLKGERVNRIQFLVLRTK